MPGYLLDACSLLALLNNEEGADVVSDLLNQAKRGDIAISIHAANMIEVYYDLIRRGGVAKADAFIREIYGTFPITIIENLNPVIVREAACLKTDGKMSFADTILVATAFCIGAIIVTCDHAELEPAERQGLVSFLWIR